MNLPVFTVSQPSEQKINYQNLKEGFVRAFDMFSDQISKGKNLLISRPILSKPDSNTKLAKTTDRTLGYKLYSLFLAPALSSGYNTCPWSSKECVALCLNTSGRGAMASVQIARIKKTKFMVEHPESFMCNMLSEMLSAMRSAENKSNKLAIRLNGTSDIAWEYSAPFIEYFCNGGSNSGVSYLDNLPKFQLYDYTKSPARVLKKPNWYDMTLSFSGHNWSECKNILDSMSGRVAMVFSDGIPDNYMGYRVVNGDNDDFRFMDDLGVIVGLNYKKTGNKNESMVKLDKWDDGISQLKFIVRHKEHFLG